LEKKWKMKMKKPKKVAPEGSQLLVKVVPGASKNEIVGWQNEELKVRIKAVPEKGKANQELISFLAESLNISKSQIHLKSGESSPHKKLFIEGISQEELRKRIKE
jgi:uncharacterized protein (TIGR00251 family)